MRNNGNTTPKTAMKSNSDLPKYFVVKNGNVLGKGITPEEAISKAENWLDLSLDVKRRESELESHDDVRLAKKSDVLNESDLFDKNWHIVNDASGDEVDFRIEAFK